jgi:hypothetical protein
MTAGFSDPHIGLVVEGQGDARALPLLLRNWLILESEFRDILGKPIPVNGRENAIATGGIEKFVATASGRPGCVGVLVVLDAESDAACDLGPAILARVSPGKRPVYVCLAVPKFEAWIVASAESMNLEDLVFDSAHDPVGLIKGALPGKYVKPTYQPRLTARIDISVAKERDSSLRRTLERFDQLRALIG